MPFVEKVRKVEKESKDAQREAELARRNVPPQQDVVPFVKAEKGSLVNANVLIS